MTPLGQQEKNSQTTFTRTTVSETLRYHQEATEPKNENTKQLLKNTALQRLQSSRVPLTHKGPLSYRTSPNEPLGFTYIKLNGVRTVLLCSMEKQSKAPLSRGTT